MKAISKLISVVLILALCMSIFTVSAFAQEPVIVIGDTLDMTDGDPAEAVEDNSSDSLPGTIANAPADSSVKVATFKELEDALKAQNPAITLTAKVSVAGPLTLDYAVKLNLGGKGCGLAFSGAGDVAIVSKAAGAEITNGNLFVTNAESVDKDGKAIGGFLEVAEGNVKMVGVHIWNFAGVGSVFGEGVNFVSGTSSKALHADDVANENGRFVYEVTEEQAEQKPEEQAEQKPEEQAEQKPEEQAEQKPEEQAEQKPEEQAEQKPEEQAEQKPEEQAEQKPEEQAEQKPEEQAEQKPEEQAEQKPEEQAEQKPEEQAEHSASGDTAESADSHVNEEPVTVEKPKEKALEEEIRIDEAAQQAAEEEKTTLTATDDVTGAMVTVTGFLPEGLTLVVKHIDTSMVGGLAEGEVALLAVDISLVDAEGNEYEPVNNPEANFRAVSVMISHPSLAAIAEDETLVLYHVEETGTTQVASASTAEGSDTMSFSTGTLSPFIVAVSKGPNTPNTGSDGEVHKKTIKITNLSGGDTYIKGSGGLQFQIEGGAAPESISIIDPDDVSSGNVDVYKAGYLIYDLDYTMSNFIYPPGEISNPINPVTVTINDAAIMNAPTGKWAVVFWFKDTTSSGSTRVYMVQYVNIVPKLEIKGVGYNYDEDTKTFEAEKCDYDSVQVLLTADLESFTITAGGVTYASYDRNVSTKKMMVRIDGKNKEVNASEYFEVSDYYATDPVGHEYIAGKTLKIRDTLLKKLPNITTYQFDVSQSNKKAPINAASDTFFITLTPGIAVADGLIDYIKGKNTWIKFVSCAPIDYDSDGTLAIWIGGQKISHDYYSISNDHCTLWIYRNLLDQLKSNNSYTLTARLWEFTRDPVTGQKVKTTYYPATASFNILAAGSTSYRSPKTGDESNIALWAAVLVLSGGAVIALIPKKKKNR